MTGARERAEVARQRWGHGTRLGLLVGVGLALVRVAFALIVPMGSAPDEASHFIKAYATVRADFGSTTDVPLAPNPTGMDRLNQSLGAVYDLGDQAVNPTWACNTLDRNVPAECVDLDAETFPGTTAVTPFGTFQPYLYAVIGLPTLVIADPDTAMLAMRLLIVLWSSIFVTAALAIVARRFGSIAVLATVAGTTPMLIYTQGTLGTTGIETAAAFATLVAALDLLWEPSIAARSSRWLLLIATASLVLCRPLSVVVTGVIAVTVAMTFGRRDTWLRIRALPTSTQIGVAAVAGIGTVANLGWSLATPDVYGGKDIGIMSTASSYVLDTLPLLWREVIGLFEWLDTELPFMALVVAWLAIVAVVIGVFPDRDRPSTMRFWFIVAATVAFGFVIDYTIFARVDGDVQARHVLPLFQLWTFLAALPNREGAASPVLSVVRERRARWAALASGAIAAIAVLYVARREAVGVEGPLWFFGEATWHPQFGWLLPFAIAAAGLALGFAAPAALAVGERCDAR